MIGPKQSRQTKFAASLAYRIATDRDQSRCVRCGSPGPIERDHRQNRDAYNTVVSNLQCLGGPFGCGCHKWKTEHPHRALLEGFSVPRYARPEVWPAYRFGVGWVLYYDTPIDGKWWQQISQATADLIMQEGKINEY